MPALLQTIKDIIFPIFCIACNQEGSCLCYSCLQKIQSQTIFSCPVCAVNNTTGKPCPECHKKSFLDKNGALFVYKEGTVIANLLQEMKYNYVEDALLPLTQPLLSFYQNNSEFFQNIDWVVPVPLHARRFAERGFNQSELIANILQKECTLPVQKVLKRIRFTRPQVGLSHDEREKNVADAFVVTQNCTRKHILLVDDVFTTGSTMQACAKSFQQNGAASVTAFTIARAV